MQILPLRQNPTVPGSPYFLVSSRGHMATTWLTNALNAIPGTFAVHGNSPESEFIKDLTLVSDKLIRLTSLKPAFRCGLVHMVNASKILAAGTRGAFCGSDIRAVQLVRNPVMLAEAMACVTVREWQGNAKYAMWTEDMRRQVLADRWNKAVVVWPATVKAAMIENDPERIKRLGGIWSRTMAEALEALYFEILVQHIKVNPSFGLAACPAYRFEDYTTDIDVFQDILNYLLRGPIARDVVVGAFGAAEVNKHRNSGTNDPAQVYRAWSEAERDLFTMIFAITGLWGFYEKALSYTFPYLDRTLSDGRYARLETSNIPGVTMHYDMLTVHPED